MERIIYKNVDASIGILIPTAEALTFATIIEIAEKDVPHDLPYWIVNADEIPTDRTFRDAWEIDESLGDPVGFGGLSNEFDSKLLAIYKESLK